jgi:hypothetical protein
MKRPPTDLQILEEIYKRYYPSFSAFSPGNPTRSAKVFVPIDIMGIAKRFGVDPDIIFGRLYYHLQPKYGLVEPDGTRVSFFSLQIGSDEHCVQFPLLAAVIAELREERNKHLLITGLSIAAISISLVSLAISIFARIPR